tara:strand:+ start:60 stop:365 length:306 start_codon:yes stop_codon:yes gene_type:complete
MNSEKEPVQVEPVAPFLVDLSIYESEDEYVVANRFTGQKAQLTPTATAVYDVLISAEQMASSMHKEGEQMSEQEDMLWNIVRKGLDWFREHYPKEYMILLD